MHTFFKSLVRMAAALTLTAVLAVGFVACGDGTVETVEGTWKSNDGHTLVLDEGRLSLYDVNGDNCLPYESLEYVWTVGELYVNIDGQEYEVFTVDLNEDTLKLTYIAETMGVSDSDVTTITMTREKA